MHGLAELQGQFAGAVLDPAVTIPDGIVGPDGDQSPRRFAVYRNNVVAGLIAALMESYPVVTKIVGEEFFSAMARQFVSAHPPASPVMLEYGDGFAEFIQSFEPAASLPYLADVAHIERAWIEAYHAADANALTGNDFASISQSSLPRLRLQLHPTLRFLISNYPALTIWKMNVDDAVSAVDLESGGEEILICRPAYDVHAFPLPEGTSKFLESIQRGQTLDSAAQNVWVAVPGFEITRALTGLIECGAFVGWTIPNNVAQSSEGPIDHD